MSIHTADRKTFLQPSPQATQVARLPAPIKGIDSRTVLSVGNPEYCIYSYNLLPNEYGMKIRSGYKEWCIDLETAPSLGLGVGTIISFDSTDNGTALDRLFAVTNEGIWDVTAFNSPVLKINFADTTQGSGFGVYTHYITQAETAILLYADANNGLFEYDQGTDTWQQVVNISGPNLQDIVFVMEHKQRLWMIEKNSTKAWYLPVASNNGVATEFFFGNKFAHGGNLVGCYNWTLDGGDGIDDILVAVSRAGDVIPYKGSDPSSADTWQNIGIFYIGQLPKGNRISSEHGGNLYLLSSFGLISMEDLVSGVDPTQSELPTTTNKIATIIRNQMRKYLNYEGWGVRLLPSTGGILIASPKQDDGTHLQYYYNFTTTGWAFSRDVPILGFDEWNGSAYFGSLENKVYKFEGAVDDFKITPPVGVQNGEDIHFSILSNYSTLGSDGIFKRGKYVRPDFIATSLPHQTSKFVYDYDLFEIQVGVGAPLYDTEGWDAGIWDRDIWQSSFQQGYHVVNGSWGMGRTIAIAMAGSSRQTFSLVSWDIMWDMGAPL